MAWTEVDDSEFWTIAESSALRLNLKERRLEIITLEGEFIQVNFAEGGLTIETIKKRLKELKNAERRERSHRANGANDLLAEFQS